MDSVNAISVVLRVSRSLLVAGARVMVLGSTLTGTGCIIIPVPSLSPCYETGMIDETTLESLTGLDQDEVNGRVGWPDYSGLRGQSYLAVLELFHPRVFQHSLLPVLQTNNLVYS